MHEQTRIDPAIHDHVPVLRAPIHRDHAHGCLPVHLRLPRLRAPDETEGRRLLRLLLVRRCTVPADPRGAPFGMSPHKKRTRDANQLAKSTVDIATGERTASRWSPCNLLVLLGLQWSDRAS
jgi:hypothetical protein